MIDVIGDELCDRIVLLPEVPSQILNYIEGQGGWNGVMASIQKVLHSHDWQSDDIKQFLSSISSIYNGINKENRNFFILANGETYFSKQNFPLKSITTKQYQGFKIAIERAKSYGEAKLKESLSISKKMDMEIGICYLGALKSCGDEILQDTKWNNSKSIRNWTDDFLNENLSVMQNELKKAQGKYHLMQFIVRNGDKYNDILKEKERRDIIKKQYKIRGEEEYDK